MLKVSAAEFQRNFGRYQDEALKQPLSISRNGRERLVFKTEELSDAEINAITEGEMDPRHASLDAELE
jgi:hypothetical protein